MQRHNNAMKLLMLILLLVLNAQAAQGPRQFLRDGWRIQSSAAVNADGAALSQAGFTDSSWYPTRVPTTVLAALVENKVYPDPYFGVNLRSIPGTDYPVGENFSDLPMPADSPFRSSWWYRTEFRSPALERGQRAWLHFDGINFRANVWLNGQRLAASNEIAGTFRLHRLDVTDALRSTGANALAVEVIAPAPHELGLTWVDWNPAPPDKDMGIFRDVFLTTSGAVTLGSPHVTSRLEGPAFQRAHLTVGVEAHNASEHAVTGTLRGRIEGVPFTMPVTLAPGETREFSFTPEHYRQLNLRHPRLWWPAQMGAQALYKVEVTFEVAQGVSDRRAARFGIREVTSELDTAGHRLFKVNGRRFLVRGGGWASDMMLRYSLERVRSEFAYVKDMNLNTIRLEGNLEPDSFFDLADQQGIMVMAGWPCCSHWEQWERSESYAQGPVWGRQDHEIAAASQEDQIRRLRGHPSLLAWLNGSDGPPPPHVERTYLDILKRLNWPNPVLSSASDKPTVLTGSTGVKMLGPYDWVPPSYWQRDKTRGGAHGFATEIGPGPAVPPFESLRRMLPQEDLWPIGEAWKHHAGGGVFRDMNVFTEALEARYGAAKDARDYARKAQAMAYEGERAMFEAFTANRYGSTGVIQWMFNNAWPSMIWHLYDYYLEPGGGYFGVKKACEPVHAQYSYADRSVLAVNMTGRALKNAELSARVFDVSGRERFTKTLRLDVPADGTTTAFTIPKIEGLSTTYFLRLTLKDGSSGASAPNFYWLSTQDEVLDWEKSDWNHTPVSAYADLSALQSLAPTKLSVSAHSTHRAGQTTARVSVANSGKHLAFFVRLRLVKAGGDEDVLPVIRQDDYFSLLPGEAREISISYQSADAGAGLPGVVAEAWNAPPTEAKR